MIEKLIFVIEKKRMRRSNTNKSLIFTVNHYYLILLHFTQRVLAK